MCLITREPAPRGFERVQLGDVGYISGGGFNLLFSAGRPLDGRQPGVDVPADFEELMVERMHREPRAPGCLVTKGVKVIGQPVSLEPASPASPVSYARPPTPPIHFSA